MVRGEVFSSRTEEMNRSACALHIDSADSALCRPPNQVSVRGGLWWMPEFTGVQVPTACGDSNINNNMEAYPAKTKPLGLRIPCLQFR